MAKEEVRFEAIPEADLPEEEEILAARSPSIQTFQQKQVAGPCGMRGLRPPSFSSHPEIHSSMPDQERPAAAKPPAPRKKRKEKRKRWSQWDHLVQDYDPKRDNYVPDVAAHPSKYDVNYCPPGGKAACRRTCATRRRWIAWRGASRRRTSRCGSTSRSET